MDLNPWAGIVSPPIMGGKQDFGNYFPPIIRDPGGEIEVISPHYLGPWGEIKKFPLHFLARWGEVPAAGGKFGELEL